MIPINKNPSSVSGQLSRIGTNNSSLSPWDLNSTIDSSAPLAQPAIGSHSSLECISVIAEH